MSAVILSVRRIPNRIRKTEKNQRHFTSAILFGILRFLVRYAHKAQNDGVHYVLSPGRKTRLTRRLQVGSYDPTEFTPSQTSALQKNFLFPYLKNMRRWQDPLQEFQKQ